MHYVCVVAIIVVIPFLIVDICLAVYNDWIFLLFSPCFILFIALAYFTKPKGALRENIMTTYISIDNDIVIRESKVDHSEYKTDDIKKIIDYGDFYRLVFKFPKISYVFICQKNLMTKGTIADFEKRFDGIIEKKVLKLR